MLFNYLIFFLIQELMVELRATHTHAAVDDVRLLQVLEQMGGEEM